MNDPLFDLGRLEGVPSAVAAARAAADTILRDRGTRQIAAETSAQALLAGARDSAAIESPDDVARWEAGSVRLSTELIDLAGQVRTAPGQALARAHSLLAKGVVADDDLGRVVATDQARLSALLDVLAKPTKAPALVQAAIAHAEIALIQPFGGGDGIIARAVEHMVLIDAGVDPRAVLLPEAGHRAAGRAYNDALARYSQGSITGVREWILHCAQALTYGAEVSPLGAARRFRKEGNV